jgi:hypothetical protein
LTPEYLLKLALVPTAVALASLAARRWGHAVSGYLGGLPMIGGPITLYLALDHGNEFAARSALVTLAAILGQAAHITAFTHAGVRRGWKVALASGWISYAVVGIAIASVELTPVIALALAAGGLLAAWRLLPQVRGTSTLPTVPRVELWLRLVAAVLLAIVILEGARLFGPVVSGVLLSVPITGSIMPPFTLALYGPDALARLMRGFVIGLTGFTAFFFTVAVALVPLGVTAAFLAALAAALLAAAIVSRLPRRRLSP